MVFRPTAAFMGVANIDDLTMNDVLTDSFTYAERMSDNTLSWTTVTITLLPTVQAGGAQAPGFLAGLQNGIAALGASIGIAITALGFLLPFLLILAVIAIPVTWVIVRRARRPR